MSWQRALQPIDQRLNLLRGGPVRRLNVAVHEGVRYDGDLVLNVIEDQQTVGQHEDRFWYVNAAARRLRHTRFKVLDGVVRDVADRPARKIRQSGHLGVADVRHARLEYVQRIDLAARLARTGAQYLKRLGADEAVAGQVLAALDRFQQERVGAAGDLQVGGHRRFKVGADLPVDRNGVVLLGERFELFKSRGVHGVLRVGLGPRRDPGRW